MPDVIGVKYDNEVRFFPQRNHAPVIPKRFGLPRLFFFEKQNSILARVVFNF